MTVKTARTRHHLLSQKSFWVSIALVLLIVFVVANVQFIQVAFETQPDCVPHASDIDQDDTTFRAAKSGC